MCTLRGLLSLRLSASSRQWMGDAMSVARMPQLVRVKTDQLQANADYSGYSTAVSPPSPRTNGTQGRKVFVDYKFYKTRGAMSMKPVKPIFKLLDTGSAVLEREGSLFLEFAPPIAQRQYDWARKQEHSLDAPLLTTKSPLLKKMPVAASTLVNWNEFPPQVQHGMNVEIDASSPRYVNRCKIFALSVMELGTLVGLSMGESCEFFHDPNMGKSDAGKIRKSLKIEPMKDQGGFYFNLSVVNKSENIDERVNIALTRSEFSVMRSSINYIIPYLMGWHMFVDPSKLDDFLVDDAEANGLPPANEWDK